ncbi:MAG TPA: flavin reductase family protein [Thermoleophilaceae bacterium]
MDRQQSQIFNSRDFRDAVGAFATGINVITTRNEENGYGLTANAFSSVSLDPPLVLICVGSSSQGCDVIQEIGAFAVNVLAHDQEPLSRFFASKERPRGRDAFKDVPHSEAITGCPLLDDAAAHLDCRLHAAHEAGDHMIFIGAVVAMTVDREAKPLIFHGGGYAALK